MAKLGSDKRPAVVRVRTMPKGEEIVALCERHHLDGNRRYRTGPTRRSLGHRSSPARPRRGAPGTSRGAQDRPQCLLPCRSGQEVQELLCNPLSAWKRNHWTIQIAEPKAD